MAVTIVKSTDAGYSGITNSAGTLITLLNTLLVTNLSWTSDYTGTNKATYKAPSGSQKYLRVDDSAGPYALCRGYDTMSDVDTGTGLFPTVAQNTNGLYVQKSNSATARPWWFITDGTLFHLFFDYTASANSYNLSHITFGDFYSYKTSDSYNSVIISYPNNSSVGSHYPCAKFGAHDSQCYIAGRYDGLAGGVGGYRLPLFRFNTTSLTSGSTTEILSYPDLIRGNLFSSPITLGEIISGSQGAVRGLLPGMWYVCHPFPYVTGDIVDGLAGTILENRQFMAFGYQGNYGTLVEISDTWYDVIWG